MPEPRIVTLARKSADLVTAKLGVLFGWLVVAGPGVVSLDRLFRKRTAGPSAAGVAST